MNNTKQAVTGGHLNKQLEVIATDLILQQAVKDKLSKETPGNNSCQADCGKINNENTDEPKLIIDEDVDLLNLREMRRAKIKALQKRRQICQEMGGGTYDNVDETQFFQLVTKADRVVCHFYHKEFERCEIFDRHLKVLAETHVETRFIRIDSTKCPFIIAKLAIRTLPVVIIFVKGLVSHRIVGFSELGNSDAFKTASLAKLIKFHKGIFTNNDTHILTSDEED